MIQSQLVPSVVFRENSWKDEKRDPGIGSVPAEGRHGFVLPVLASSATSGIPASAASSGAAWGREAARTDQCVWLSACVRLSCRRRRHPTVRASREELSHSHAMKFVHACGHWGRAVVGLQASISQHLLMSISRVHSWKIDSVCAPSAACLGPYRRARPECAIRTGGEPRESALEREPDMATSK